MKPWYQSKKVWTAVVTILGIIVSDILGKPEYRRAVVLVGMTLIGGFGLADMGKEAKALGPSAEDKAKLDEGQE